jgi:hypothetical protein
MEDYNLAWEEQITKYPRQAGIIKKISHATVPSKMPTG